MWAWLGRALLAFGRWVLGLFRMTVEIVVESTAHAVATKVAASI